MRESIGDYAFAGDLSFNAASLLKVRELKNLFQPAARSKARASSIASGESP